MKNRKLTKTLESRVKKIHSILGDVDDKSLEEWLEGFEQDYSPAREVYYFDVLAHAYAFYSLAHTNEMICKETLYRCLSSFLLGRDVNATYEKYNSHFTREDIEEMKIYFDSASEGVHRHYR